MYYPPLFKTNFKSSDGLDLGEKLISKDYLLSSYPNLLDSISASSLFIWGVIDSNTSYNTSPVQASPSSFFGKVKQISSNKWQSGPEYYSALIKSDGSLWTIGTNQWGQLGLNDRNPRSAFSQVLNSPDGNNYNWKQVYCGSRSTVAIKKDGTLWTCGYNNKFQLGLKNTTNSSIFKQVGIDTDWKYACIGEVHGLAIKEDGSLYTWGTNRSGVLGKNSTDVSETYTSPTRIGLDNDWNYINTSNHTSCAIKSDGSLYIWGNYNFCLNDFGAITCTNFYYQPTKILGSSFVSTNDIPSNTSSDDWKWKMMSFGYSHASAIRADGTLWSIGDNYLGGLGINNSSPSSSTSFLQIATKGIWKQVDCGNYFSAAIRSDGTLWTWGYSNRGQMGRGITGSNRPVGQVSGYWSQVSCQPFAVKAIKTYDYI
jgi:hypothetical protein